MTDTKRYYSSREVADMFKVDLKTVDRWATSGRVASIRTPGGAYRFPVDEIDAFFESTMRGELPEIAALERAIRGYYSARPTQALLDLAHLLGIDVAYLDCDRFIRYAQEHHGHDLTTDEWNLVRSYLGGFGNVVEERCRDIISAYMDHILRKAEIIPGPREKIRTNSKESPSRRVAEIIRERIVNGDWKPGRKIPPQLSLSLELGVSIETIQKANTILSGRGYLKTVRGSGTYVRPEQDWENGDESITQARDAELA